MAAPETMTAAEASANTSDHRSNGGSLGPHLAAPKTAGLSAERSRLERLWEHYGTEDWDEVSEFLSHHPALPPLLMEAYPRLNDAFGGDQSIHLRLVTGYGEGEPALLFADVVTEAAPMVAFTQMNKFEDGWWLEAMTAAEGLLHFSLEFA